jgi:sodium pump decarboxylase gamma subunit
MFGITDYSKPIIDFSNFDISQLGQAAGFGGAMVLIGMATIFAVLCLLWVCLVLFKIVFHDIPEKRKNAAVAVEEVTEAAPATAVAHSDDEEIVAVIAAAIAMAESESSGTKFKVVSFKRN